MTRAPAFERARSPAWCDRLYRPFCWCAEPEPPAGDPVAWARQMVPDPGRSWEQALRWRHADLPDMTAQDLWRERQRAAFMAAWLPEGEGRTWSEQRLRAVANEEQRRKGRHGS